MRGIAALAAAAAVWILVVGEPRVSLPRLPGLRPTILIACVGSGLGGAIVAFGLLGTVAPAAAIGVLTSAIPIRIDRTHRDRVRREQSDRWPDLIAHMRSSVAAGETLPDSFVAAADRVGNGFEKSAQSVRHEITYGAGFDAAIAQLRHEMDDPIADRILSTIGIARQTGGHRVGEVLAALGASVADETRLRKAHEAALTEQRWTATVALIAPWVLLALSIATNPQAAVAFDTSEGVLVVAVGLAATGFGWLLSRRASKLSEIPRLFT